MNLGDLSVIGLASILAFAGSGLASIDALAQVESDAERAADLASAVAAQHLADAQFKANETAAFARFLTGNFEGQAHLVAAMAEPIAGAVLRDAGGFVGEANDASATFVATGAAALNAAAEVTGIGPLEGAGDSLGTVNLAALAEDCDFPGSDAWAAEAGLSATWSALRAMCQGAQDHLVDL